jgi:universal stress protein E
MTIVPFYGRVEGHLSSDEKWKLLRNAPNPVLLASQQELKESRRMLCSIKTQDEGYADKNEQVLSVAKQMANNFDIELHVVNAYSDSMAYPDRAKIASEIGIANDHINVKMGSPEDVICDTAEELESPLVVIASQRRSGFKGALRGNTVEKILERVNRDVLLV